MPITGRGAIIRSAWLRGRTLARRGYARRDLTQLKYFGVPGNNEKVIWNDWFFPAAVGGEVTGTGAFVAQSATVTGSGISSSTGTGTFVVTDVVLNGTGLNAWMASGSLVSGLTVLTGSGISLSTGTGSLITNTSVIGGAGNSESTGIGSFVVLDSLCAGNAISGSEGTGGGIPGNCILTGVGSVTGGSGSGGNNGPRSYDLDPDAITFS